MKFKYDTSTLVGKINVMTRYLSVKDLDLYAKPLLRGNADYRVIGNPSWNWDEFDYNYPADPPRKVLKPWTFETCPKDANLWIRDNPRGMARIEYLNATGLTANGVELTYYNAMKTCEHSLDNGSTWHPCGIEVEESL